MTVFLLITVSVTGTFHAQTLSDPPQKNRTDLRQAIWKETEKLKNESAALDVKKIEKIDRQTPQKHWSKRDKLLITGVIAGLVVLAVVLALTTKRCVRRSPEGCNFADDINCQCLEYAE